MSRVVLMVIILFNCKIMWRRMLHFLLVKNLSHFLTGSLVASATNFKILGTLSMKSCQYHEKVYKNHCEKDFYETLITS